MMSILSATSTSDNHGVLSAGSAATPDGKISHARKNETSFMMSAGCLLSLSKGSMGSKGKAQAT
jgi:hypothetical protein